ncbi:MAG TPA: UDP-N-acetylmuramoyl-tripeptide--D-alanyl-D-alanine ligase [Arcobacter sp.]|nr:UDP-N-acetylmuramoyl-tripeptide--D-alanyl-D-alanine ligase [Arcobacter sp.]HIP56260.1 UDP-N-acetylmuramoyl-tripeptide--D-alanyl-D-alanine ligase [Arcobacter sp.]
MQYIEIFTNIILIISLGWYLITNLQWYNYKLDRVILKHHKQQWHIIYFLSPIALFYLLEFEYFLVYFYLLYLTSFILWNRNLSKSLVLTSRVKRFLGILLFTIFIIDGLCFLTPSCSYGVFIPLFLTFGITTALEKIFFLSFKHKAKQRIKAIRDLKIIAITASYGKTSIKNYLYQVLNKNFNTYMTPRSVNTIGGLCKDVNDDLPLDTQIYIAEAGARQKGDIEEITNFLEPQYTIIGSVGEQHIEYFKTLDNIIHTKMEILKSPRLEHGFVHDSVPIKEYETITKFPHNLHIVRSDLQGIWFDIEINSVVEHFHAPILGSFNAINLTAVILTSHKLGLSIDEIKIALDTIKPVEHRLHLSKAGGKLILDDSFNGNLEGMLEAIKISSTHEKRKVIVTPGLVESTIEANTQLAKMIDKVFDLVIITGTLNKKVLEENILSTTIIILKDKSDMENTLLENTHIDDLILFANDAPSFI